MNVCETRRSIPTSVFNNLASVAVPNNAPACRLPSCPGHPGFTHLSRPVIWMEAPVANLHSAYLQGASCTTQHGSTQAQRP